MAKPNAVKLGFTGRLKVGKDFVAHSVGATVHGFADPLYALCRNFFGSDNKDLAGMRQTMQQVGQWGRGVVNEAYPLTAQRGIFSVAMRANGEGFCDSRPTGVSWQNYGLDEALWVKALLARVAAADPASIIGVVNLRFQNEYRYLAEAGFKFFHVMCSPETYTERLAAAGMAEDSPALSDLSEHLALDIDRHVLADIAETPEGKKMNVIWSDHRPRPSSRLFFLDEFKLHVELLGGGQ